MAQMNIDGKVVEFDYKDVSVAIQEHICQNGEIENIDLEQYRALCSEINDYLHGLLKVDALSFTAQEILESEGLL